MLANLPNKPIAWQLKGPVLFLQLTHNNVGFSVPSKHSYDDSLV